MPIMPNMPNMPIMLNMPPLPYISQKCAVAYAQLRFGKVAPYILQAAGLVARLIVRHGQTARLRAAHQGGVAYRHGCKALRSPVNLLPSAGHTHESDTRNKPSLSARTTAGNCCTPTSTHSASPRPAALTMASAHVPSNCATPHTRPADNAAARSHTLSPTRPPSRCKRR